MCKKFSYIYYSFTSVYESYFSLLPPTFKSWFSFCSDPQNYHIVSSTADKIFKPSYRTYFYGKNSITLVAINSWNKTEHQFRDLSLKMFSPTKVKILPLPFNKLKNALENINEEVEGVILIKQTNLLLFSQQLTIRFNFNTY